MDNDQSVFSVQQLDFYYGPSKALGNINLDIQRHQVTALIGPSGCGKSTFLRCLNRMNDTIAGTRVDGKILLDGKNIYDPDLDVVTLRQRVGIESAGRHESVVRADRTRLHGLPVSSIHFTQMKVFIVYAHAEPKSFNGALYQPAQGTLR